MSARSSHSSLEWSFLEVEEDEWTRRTAALESAAAANGFPVYTGPQHTGPTRPDRAPAADACQGRSHGRQVLLAAAGVLVLLAVVSYKLWYTAQQGIEKMEQDVANVVKLETIKARAAQPQLPEHASVEAIEFVDDKAMAQVVITRTWSASQVIVQRETLFYVQTAQGWQRTGAVAAFWGEPQTLDTPNLHFVFRSKDRAAVEQLAHGAEALYVALRRATGESLAAEDGRLTIEVVPEQVPSHETFVHGSVRLPSPRLFDLAFGYTAEDVLHLLARKALASPILDAALQRRAVKPQWEPLVEGLRLWLTESNDLPLASTADISIFRMQAGSYRAPRLIDLLGCRPCSKIASERAHIQSVSWYMYGQQQLSGAASLIDFTVATYGIDVLPALLQGFGRYEEWETLAPAVFGASAAELEAAWHGNAGTDP
jgi:hypothetical protein